MKNHIQIGEIYREHGLKGLCKVYIFSQSDENLEPDQKYVLKAVDGRILNTKIETVSYSQKFFLVKFDCFQGGDQVIPWRKAEIWIPEDALQREEGEIFDYEWHGLTLYDASQKKIGTITGVEYNPLPQFVVDCDGKSVLIPRVEGWILEHNPEDKKLVMDLPDGLLDLDDRKGDD